MIRLPWPDKHLSPNARVHWAQKAKAVDEAKKQAYYMAKAAGICFEPDTPLELWMNICPPDHRRRDLDNIHASLKAALDGIFQAAGVDDSAVLRTILEWGDVEPKGSIYIKIASLEKDL